MRRAKVTIETNDGNGFSDDETTAVECSSKNQEGLDLFASSEMLSLALMRTLLKHRHQRAYLAYRDLAGAIEELYVLASAEDLPKQVRAEGAALIDAAKDFVFRLDEQVEAIEAGGKVVVRRTKRKASKQ